MRRVALACLLSAVSFAQAVGQTIPANYPNFPNIPQTTGGVSQLTSTPVQPTDLVNTFRIVNSPLVPGPLLEGYSALPLSSFAFASDIASTNSELASLQAAQQRFAGEVRSKLANGVALAGAMDMIRPAAGMANRFGGQVTDYDGRAAVAFNYMHQSGRFDVGAAAGFASGGAMGKLGAGVSW